MARKILLVIIRTVVSISLIGFLLLNLGKENIKEFPSYLKNVSYPFIFISILIFLIAVMLGTVRWGKLLEVQGIRFKFSQVFQLTFIGFFFSNFLPGLVGGDAVKLYYTARNTRKTAGSLASILLDRLLAIFALLIIAVFAVLFTFGITEIRKITLLVFGLFVIFLITVFLFFNLKSSPILKKLYRIKSFDLGNKIKNFKNSMVVYRKRKDVLVYTFFISVIIQLLIAVVIYFVSRSLNLSMPLGSFFLFVPLIQLIAFVPITIAGLGLREFAFIFFFTTVGGIIPQMDAFALSIAFYLVSLITSSLGGILYLFRGGELKQ